MVTTTFLICYLRDGAQAHDSVTIERFFTMFARRGYTLQADSPLGVFDLRRELRGDLRRELGQYLAGRTREFQFQAWAEDPERAALVPRLSCCLAPEESIVFVSVEDTDFDDRYTDGHGAQCYWEWLQLIEQIYAVWRPLYGFETGNSGCEGFIERDAALSLDVTFVYGGANLFGPELAAKLGRERLLAAPADYIRPLDDGGVFLVPVTRHDLNVAPEADGDAPAETPSPPSRGFRDARRVAAHLGMEYLDWSIYMLHWRDGGAEATRLATRRATEADR